MAKTKGDILQLDGLECSNIMLAVEALRNGKTLPPRIMEQLGYLSGRCSEALEDS